MTIVIKFTANQPLSEEHNSILFNFLSEQIEDLTAKHFVPNQIYTTKDISFTLGNHIIRRFRQKSGHPFEAVLNTVGKGGYGSVYAVRSLVVNSETLIVNDKVRVIKAIRLNRFFSISSFYNEHRFTKLVGYLKPKDPTFIGDMAYFVMKKISGRELIAILIEEAESARYFSMHFRIRFCLAVISAVNELDEKMIGHGDLNNANFLVDIKGDEIVVKIIDFGKSYYLPYNPNEHLFIEGTKSKQTNLEGVANILYQFWQEPFAAKAHPETTKSIYKIIQRIRAHDAEVDIVTLTMLFERLEKEHAPLPQIAELESKPSSPKKRKLVETSVSEVSATLFHLPLKIVNTEAATAKNQEALEAKAESPQP